VPVAVCSLQCQLSIVFVIAPLVLFFVCRPNPGDFGHTALLDC
jgi:hypothetical protein